MCKFLLRTFCIFFEINNLLKKGNVFNKAIIKQIHLHAYLLTYLLHHHHHRHNNPLMVQVLLNYLWAFSAGRFYGVLLLITRLTPNLEEKLIYLPTYLLSPSSRAILEKLTVSQLLKKFPTFYVIRMFITALTTARQIALSWSDQPSPRPPIDLWKTRFNIILSSTPRSSKWFLSTMS